MICRYISAAVGVWLERMILRITLLCCLLPCVSAWGAGRTINEYLKHEPKDRLARLQPEIESGRVPLDTTDDKAFLTSLLKVLDVPVTAVERRPLALLLSRSTFTVAPNVLTMLVVESKKGVK